MKRSVLASLLCASLLISTVVPTTAFADALNPSQPESIVSEHTETEESNINEDKTEEIRETESIQNTENIQETGNIQETENIQETVESSKASLISIENDSSTSSQDLTKDFVSRLYITLLLRNPDPDGLDAWTAQLKSGDKTGADIISGFIFSDEFKANNYSDEDFVEIMYNALFDRGSDPTGKSGWLNCLSEGLSRAYVCSGFIGSDEFKTLCQKYEIIPGQIQLTEIVDQHPNIAHFVNYLYKYILDRNADPEGLKAWVTVLANHANSASEVVSGFVFSKEFQGKNLSNTEYIDTLYTAILNRNSDPEGLNAWLQTLDDGLSKRNVLRGFLASEEFKKLCAKYGMVPGDFEVTEFRDQNADLTKYINNAYKGWYKRSAIDSELNQWTEQIISNKATIIDFLNALIASADISSLSNEDYIELAYETILQREASPSEISGCISTLQQSKQKFLNQLTGSKEFETLVSKMGFSLHKEGWNSTSTGWYYIKNGNMLSGWQKLNGQRYYFDASKGYTRATGWTYIGGYKYYFDNNGRLQQNVDGIIGRQSSYRLTVNTSTNTVTVYAKDGNNGYIIPVKTMICSTGVASTPTVKGTFNLGYRWRWSSLMGGVWGQYVTQIYGSYLFHSAWYYSQNNRSLSVSEYRKLGNNASHGCVRLTVGDAKWIYDNCYNSTVTVTTSCFEPFTKPARPNPVTIRGDYGYDPTDPSI